MYLDKKELAKVLNIPITSIDYYRREKGMPSIKIGKHNRYVLSDIRNWLEKTKQN